MRTSPDILNAIRDMDPDGQDFGAVSPTNNDYLNFHAAVLAEFGKRAWDDYHRPAKEHGTYE